MSSQAKIQPGFIAARERLENARRRVNLAGPTQARSRRGKERSLEDLSLLIISHLVESSRNMDVEAAFL